MSLGRKYISGEPVCNGLYNAIFSGDIVKVNSIIDSHGLSHCPHWAEGQDLLWAAIDCKHLGIAKLLVKRGCKIEYKEGDDVPSIFIKTLSLAAYHGDCELITLFLNRISDTQSKVKLLNSFKVLHIAVHSEQVEVVKLLLFHGADPGCKIKNGEFSPLHVAAVYGNEEIVELLLDAGSNLESKDSKGNTSLALAVYMGKVDVVKTLVTRGADCNSKNNLGKSPLFDATRAKYYDDRYLQIVKYLLTFEADVNYKYIGMGPLHLACLMRNLDLIPLLLDAGADVNITDFTGVVPYNIFPSDLIAKQIIVLKTGGFYLSKENEALYDDDKLNVMAPIIASTSKSCEEELSKMKTMKSSNGVALYEIFQKLKNPLSLVSENEIKFLESIKLKHDFPMYESIMRNSLKVAKLRNELISLGQDWLLYLNENRQDDVTFLPEEMRIHILSFLTNEDIKTLIQYGEEIHKQKS